MKALRNPLFHHQGLMELGMVGLLMLVLLLLYYLRKRLPVGPILHFPVPDFNYLSSDTFYSRKQKENSRI